MKINRIKKLSLSALLVCLMLTGGLARATASTELADFLDEVQKKAETIRSLQADFVQEKHLALFSQPVLFNGIFVLVKPDRLRWEFVAPVPSVLILNKEKAIRCNDQAAPETINLSSDPIMKGVADQLWLWLGGGYDQLKEQYSITKTAELSLSIQPRDEKTAGFIDHVEISFEDTTLLPAEVTIFEPGGDKTIIRFINNRINPDVPDTFFTSCAHVR